MNKKRAYAKFVGLQLLAVLLAVSMIMPSLSFAEEVGQSEDVRVSLSKTFITESGIRGGSQELILTLESGEWAEDFRDSLKVDGTIDNSNPKAKLLINSMHAVFNKTAWDSYKGNLRIKKDDLNKKIIIIEMLQKENFTIEQNEIITVDLPSVLFKNWKSVNQSVSFEIVAMPRVSLGGTITDYITYGDLQQGGKTIEIRLLNAEWKKEDIYKTMGFNAFLEGFTVGNNTWSVAESLKYKDPNQFISFPGDSTLLLTLPPVSIDSSNDEQSVVFKLDDSFYTKDINNDDDLIQGREIGFTVHPKTAPSSSKLEVTTSLKEEDIINGRASLSLTLTGAEWSSLTDEKRLVLIDALTAKEQSEQWEQVKDAIKQKVLQKDIDYNKIITLDEVNNKLIVNIPETAGLSLVKDQNVSINIPYQLLKTNVELKEASFIIKAQPKALLTGTAVPELKQADFAKGGKTVIISLVNTEWNSDITTNTQKREALLDAFTWPVGTVNEIKARADVQSTDNQTVTITLPSISGKVTGHISFDPAKIAGLIANATLFKKEKVEKAITVLSAENQTMSVATTVKSEFDIEKGGKTVTLTLKNDSWAASIIESKISIKAKDSSGIKKTIAVTAVERVSDQVLIATLAPVSKFTLNENTEAEIIVDPVLLLANPASLKGNFKISAVTASLSGTGLSMDAVDLQKGGKTVIITLNGADFINGTIDNSKISSILIPASGSLPWKGITDIKVTKNRMTIKLPPVPNATFSGRINVEIPTSLMVEGPQNSKKAAGSFTVGAEGSATISATSILEEEILKGGKKISIQLSNAAWDPAIETNKGKKSALLKGFKTADQTKEWALVTSAISANGVFKVNGGILEITIPEVPAYSLIREQVVEIVIPKTALSDYKYDIPVNQLLTVKLPTYQDLNKSFAELLNEGIKESDLNDIRIKVPDKKVQTISVNTTDFPASGQGTDASVTTVEITAAADVKKVEVTVAGEQTSIMKEATGSNKFLFVFSNVEKNSELKVTVYGSGTKPMQADIYKKIGKGSKTYSEVPKKDLAGSYSLYTLLTDKSMIKDILKYYTTSELAVLKTGRR